MADILKDEEIWGLPLREYPARDSEGREIVIRPKIPEEHESHHPLEQSSTYFYNLRDVIDNPDKIEDSSSQNPHHLKNVESGETKVFIKDNFVNWNLRFCPGCQ